MRERCAHAPLGLVLALALGCGSSSAAGSTEAEPEAHAPPALATHAPPAPTPTPAPTPAPAPAPAPAEAPPTEAPRARALVKLIVLGEFDATLIDAVEAGLRAELSVDVERIEGLRLPPEAYYPPRRRYRADRLLTHLNAHLDGQPETTRVLGMTSVDISTTKPPHEDWGVFGLGELGGRSCVISTHRLRRRARDTDHVTFRVVTTAVHEVGHTLGLEHCDDPGCVMRDAEGSIATVDTSTGHLGPICTRLIDERSPRVLPYRE
jgi:archaemetzincin